MSGFYQGAGFSASWMHWLMLLIAGCVVMIALVIIITGLVHKLNSGAIENGADTLIYLIITITVGLLVFGVVNSM